MGRRVKPVWCCFHQEYYIVRNYILYSGLACISLAEKWWGVFEGDDKSKDKWKMLYDFNGIKHSSKFWDNISRALNIKHMH